jgi:hypothetical protein
MSADERLNEIVRFINYNIVSMSKADKEEILQMIFMSDIDESKIQDKGGGAQIKFKDIPVSVIFDIHKKIEQKLEKKKNDLKNIPIETS